MIHLKELDKFTNIFSQMAYEPLRITFHLVPNSRVVNYDPINLDGLLARAVVGYATQGRGVPDTEDGYWIPLPLKLLWQSQDGFPLWASTVLLPVEPTIDDIYVRHKRNSGGWLHNQPKLTTQAGPWMERRLPTPTIVCDTYQAYCIGNKEALDHLLDYFTHIGKLRLGRLDRITVEPCDEFSLWHNGVLAKPVPAAANMVEWLVNPSLVGWTPPHWKPSLFLMGWRAGTSELLNYQES